MYRVEHEGRSEIVYAVGPANDQWLFWNGQVFHDAFATKSAAPRRPSAVGANAPHALSSPMPATVLSVLVEAGAVVRAGDTLVILEAMKMELPIRAAADGVVRRIACHAGELVPAGATLVEVD
jgi:biotin carboxyl carrier protein